MSRLKEVLAFVNNKGGVGKTTTVQNVAVGLLRQDPSLRILCIDLDPQCNLSTLLGWRTKRQQFNGRQYDIYTSLQDGDKNHLPVYKSNTEGLFYVPASPYLSGIEPDLYRQMQSKQVLSTLFGNELYYMEQILLTQNGTSALDLYNEEITWMEDSFDYVLIDCAPALSELTYNALAAATGVIIPVQLGSLSVDGLGRMTEAVRAVRNKLNPDLRLLGLLIVMSDERTKLARETAQFLQDNYDTTLYHTRIRQCIRVGESQYQYQSIFDYSPDCTAARDYAAFVSELTNQLNTQDL